MHLEIHLFVQIGGCWAAKQSGSQAQKQKRHGHERPHPETAGRAWEMAINNCSTNRVEQKKRIASDVPATSNLKKTKADVSWLKSRWAINMRNSRFVPVKEIGTIILLTPPAWISKRVLDVEAPVSQIFSPLNTFLVLLMWHHTHGFHDGCWTFACYR